MMRLYAILGVTAVAVIGIFYAYFQYSQSKLAEMNRLISAQVVALQTFQEIVKNLQDDAERIKKATEGFNSALSDLRVEADRQRRVLNSHNLSQIGTSRPSLLEQRINKGTSDLFKRLEEASGLPKPEQPK